MNWVKDGNLATQKKEEEKRLDRMTGTPYNTSNTSSDSTETTQELSVHLKFGIFKLPSIVGMAMNRLVIKVNSILFLKGNTN